MASSSTRPTPSPSILGFDITIPGFWEEGCSAKKVLGPDGRPKTDANGNWVWECVTPPRAWNDTVNGKACKSGQCNAVDMNRCYSNGVPKCSCKPATAH